MRLSTETRRQLAKLQAVTGETATEVVARAIERLAQEKFRAWVSKYTGEMYDPAADQDGDYTFERWIDHE